MSVVVSLNHLSFLSGNLDLAFCSDSLIGSVKEIRLIQIKGYRLSVRVRSRPPIMDG